MFKLGDRVKVVMYPENEDTTIGDTGAVVGYFDNDERSVTNRPYPYWVMMDHNEAKHLFAEKELELVC